MSKIRKIKSPEQQLNSLYYNKFYANLSFVLIKHNSPLAIASYLTEIKDCCQSFHLTKNCIALEPKMSIYSFKNANT